MENCIKTTVSNPSIHLSMHPFIHPSMNVFGLWEPPPPLPQLQFVTSLGFFGTLALYCTCDVWIVPWNTMSSSCEKNGGGGKTKEGKGWGRHMRAHSDPGTRCCVMHVGKHSWKATATHNSRRMSNAKRKNTLTREHNHMLEGDLPWDMQADANYSVRVWLGSPLVTVSHWCKWLWPNQSEMSWRQGKACWREFITLQSVHKANFWEQENRLLVWCVMSSVIMLKNYGFLAIHILHVGFYSIMKFFCFRKQQQTFRVND